MAPSPGIALMMARSASLVSTIAVAALIAVPPLLGGCTSSATAKQDVTVTSCAVGASGRPTATGSVDNHSSKASSYAIAIGFYDSSGNRVSDGAASLARVEAAQTATFSADGTAKANGPLTCKVLSVARVVAP